MKKFIYLLILLLFVSTTSFYAVKKFSPHLYLFLFKHSEYTYLNEMNKNFKIKNCRPLEKIWDDLWDVMIKIKVNDIEERLHAKKEIENYVIKMIEPIYNSSTFNELEKTTLRNDECGVRSLELSSYFYEVLKNKEKMNEVHQRLINFANSSNIYAIVSSCSYTAPLEERIKFCEMVVKQTNPVYDEKKELAKGILLFAYTQKKQASKLTKLCETNPNSDFKNRCYERLKYLADDLFDKKDNRGIFLYKKLITFSENVRQNDTPYYKEKIKNRIMFMLQDIYYKLRDTDKLIQICESTNDPDISTSCILELKLIAFKLYNEKQFTQAAKLYAKASDLGDILSSFYLAEMYLNGVGIEKNYSRAVYRYKQALVGVKDLDMRKTIFNNMAIAYLELKKNVNAFQCLEKAAKMGDALSQLNLARLYVTGQGVLVDYKQAYAWVSIALAQGFKDKATQDSGLDLKNKLLYIFNAQASGAELIDKAESLAQQYYDQYVSHEIDDSNA